MTFRFESTISVKEPDVFDHRYKITRSGGYRLTQPTIHEVQAETMMDARTKVYEVLSRYPVQGTIRIQFMEMLS